MTNKWRWLVVFVIACAVLFGFLAVRPMVAVIEKERMMRRVNAAGQVFMAMEQSRLDRSVGYPAEIGVHSTQEYLDLLIQKGYLKISDLALFGDLVLTNISEKDPPDTVILISRSYYNYLYHGTKFPKGYIVILKSGDAEQMTAPVSRENLHLPPREPAILPPRRLALD